MKKMLIAVCSLLGMIVIYQNCSPKKKVRAITQDERTTIVAHSLYYFDSFASATNDVAAKRLNGFLIQNVVLGAPDSDGLMSWKKNDSSISMVPLFTQDSLFGGFWVELCNQKGMYAEFISKLNALVIRAGEPATASTKAITLMHESFHAFMFSQHRNKKSQTDKEYAEEELLAYLLQSDFTRKIGGQEYETFLSSEVEQTIKEFGAGIKNSQFPQRKKYDQKLDIFFGQAMSDQEKDFRATNLWITTCLYAISDLFPANQVTEKQEFFIYSLYREQGLR